MPLSGRSIDSTPPRHSDDQPPVVEDGLGMFLAAISLFAAGVALGGIAGVWEYDLAAILLVTPIVAVAARMFRRRVAGVVAFGGMAAWGVTRQLTADEPAWRLLLTFLVSLSVLSAIGWLIESLLRQRDRAMHFAETEPLTGLLNRNAFIDQLQKEIDRSRRLRHSCAVAYLDCDNFKHWNDSRGHLAGDELLTMLAATLNEHTRSYDVVARMGGDEFAVLFPEIPSVATANTVRRLHEDVTRQLQQHHWPVTISIGLVAFAIPPKTALEVIDTADRLMFDAKQHGRNQVMTQIVPAEPLSADDPLSQAG